MNTDQAEKQPEESQSQRGDGWNCLRGRGRRGRESYVYRNDVIRRHGKAIEIGTDAVRIKGDARRVETGYCRRRIDCHAGDGRNRTVGVGELMAIEACGRSKVDVTARGVNVRPEYVIRRKINRDIIGGEFHCGPNGGLCWRELARQDRSAIWKEVFRQYHLPVKGCLGIYGAGGERDKQQPILLHSCHPFFVDRVDIPGWS